MVEHLLRLEEESDSSKELVQVLSRLILSRRNYLRNYFHVMNESICNKSLIHTNILAVKPSFNSKTNKLRRGVV